MVDSRQKGYRAEAAAKDILKSYTCLDWERVPASGALDPRHKLKGDLYIPDSSNTYCVEVKHYKDDQLNSKLLTGKSPILFQWWEQALRQAAQVQRLPLLLFKYDRSKFFVATDIEPAAIDYNYIYVSEYALYIALLEDWLKYEDIEWQ